MVHMLTIGDDFLQFVIASAKIVTLVLVPFPISLFNLFNHFNGHIRQYSRIQQGHYIGIFSNWHLVP